MCETLIYAPNANKAEMVKKIYYIYILNRNYKEVYPQRMICGDDEDPEDCIPGKRHNERSDRSSGYEDDLDDYNDEVEYAPLDEDVNEFTVISVDNFVDSVLYSQSIQGPFI